MASCLKCGYPLKNSAKHCQRCGTVVGDRPEQAYAPKTFADGKVCKCCGALLPGDICLICGTRRGEAAQPRYPDVERLPEVGILDSPLHQVRTIRKTPDIWRRWGSGLSLIILVMILSVSGYNIYRQYFDTSSYRAAETVVYETVDNRLMLEYPGMDEPVVLTGIDWGSRGFVQGELRASPNGRWLAYTSVNGSLFLLDLAQQRGPGSGGLEAVHLADNIAKPAEFSKNSQFLIFLTKNQELYASDLTENWLLDTGVADIKAVDESKVLYTRYGSNSNDQLDLYLDYLDAGEWLLIDRNVVEVLDWTPGLQKIMYTGIRQGEDNTDTSCLFLFDENQKDATLTKGKTTQLADGVGRVVDASAATASAVYLVNENVVWSYADFVDDDLAEADARVTEPSIDDYPVLAAAVAIYGEAGDFTDSEDDEELVEQNRQYIEAKTLWEEKESRDTLRSGYHRLFATYTRDIVLGDLYVYKNGVQRQLDSGVWLRDNLSREGGQVDADLNYILYERIDAGSLEQMKISTLWKEPENRTYDLYKYYLDHTRRELRYSPLDGEPARLYIRSEDTEPKQWRMAPRADGVYFTVGSPSVDTSASPDELYYATIQNGVIGDAVLVSPQARQLLNAFRTGILFQGGEGNKLYLALDGAVRQLGTENAAVANIENGDNTLLFYDKATGTPPAGELHMLTKDVQLLAENAVRCIYRGDELMYILCRSEDGDALDLYTWRAGQLSLVETGVYGILDISDELNP